MKPKVFTILVPSAVAATVILTAIALFMKVDVNYYLSVIGTVVTAIAFGFWNIFCYFSNRGIFPGSDDKAERRES